MNDIYRHRFLLMISRLGGGIPLAVGWSIFLLWLVIFQASGNSVSGLQTAGLLWIGIGFIMAVTGLICLLIYGFVNRSHVNFEVWYSLLLLLSNIPSVMIIVWLHEYFNPYYN